MSNKRESFEEAVRSVSSQLAAALIELRHGKDMTALAQVRGAKDKLDGIAERMISASAAVRENRKGVTAAGQTRAFLWVCASHKHTERVSIEPDRYEVNQAQHFGVNRKLLCPLCSRKMELRGLVSLSYGARPWRKMERSLIDWSVAKERDARIRAESRRA